MAGPTAPITNIVGLDGLQKAATMAHMQRVRGGREPVGEHATPVTTETEDQRPRLVPALSETLARYANDRPIAEAARPLLDYIAAREAGARVALIRRAPCTDRLELACADALEPSWRDAVLTAAAAWWRRPVRHELHFEVLAAEGLSGRAYIAGLQITDDQTSGALLLITPEATEARSRDALSPHAADEAMQTAARVLALLVQQRANSAALIEERAMLRMILDMAPDAIVRIDDHGVIQSFNRAAERIFGYAAAEVLNEPVSMLMTAEHAPHHQGYVRRYVSSGERRLENWSRRLTARRRDGGEIPIELALGDVTIVGQRAFIGVIRDITDRVQNEARQDALRAALEHATQLSALGEMAATIAHEVNQPLTAVGNYLDAALAMIAAGAPPDQLRATLETARSGVAAGGDIVRRVRRLTTRRAPERSLTDINEAAEEALTYLEHVAEARGVALARDFQEPPPMISVDRIQLQQVIANLVRNAIQAAAGRPDAGVTVRTRADAEGLELSVTDTGPGVPAAVGERVFDSFVTGDGGGVGLGLAVCRSIVEAHGGVIWLEPDRPCGAAFHVRLPRAVEATDAAS